MRRVLLLILIGALAVVPAWAEDTAALLARADQAFVQADYQTALALYKKLEPQLAKDARLPGMQERMRSAERNLAANPPAATQPAAAAPAAARTPHKKPANGEVLELTLHELGNFDFREDDDSSIPADVMALNGEKIRITGQMLALDQAGVISRFLLVNDLMACCYGVAPKIQNVVRVTLPKDKPVNATQMRIAVEGKLVVKVQREDEFVTHIFEMEPTSIKYAPQ